jgi:hypothetical protein
VNTWKVILATIVIFGTGVITGGLLVRHAERIPTARHPRNASPTRTPAPASAGGLRLEFLRRAQRELDLTAPQREQIDELLKESQNRIRELNEPIAEAMREELRQTKDEFLEVLTEQQRTRFEELVKQQQQQHSREQRRPPPARELPQNAAPAAPPRPQ